MKIKYNFERDDKTGRLTIKEYGELDKDLMSLLCEETFDHEVIAEAIKGGVVSMISALRSNNIYPPASHVEKIAESAIAMYTPDGPQTVNVVFDDKAMMIKEREKAEQIAALKEEVDLDLEDEPDEPDELDELLANDDIKIKNTKTSLKVADEESVDIDDKA